MKTPIYIILTLSTLLVGCNTSESGMESSEEKKKIIAEISDNYLSIYSDSVLVFNSELVQKDSLFEKLTNLSLVGDSVHVNIYVDEGVKIGLVSDILKLIRDKSNIKIRYHREEFH